MIYLRPHHLLCMQGFRGKGYSDEFVKNMTTIVKQLKEKPIEEIKLVEKRDDICKFCPKMDQLKMMCQSDQHVLELDFEVMKTLELEYNTSYTMEFIISIMKLKLKRINFNEICEKCSWKLLGFCEEGLEEKLQWTRKD